MHVLSWHGVAPTGLCITSVSFRNAIKRSFLQEVVYTYVSLLFPGLIVALAVSLSRRKNENCDESEKELGDWCENGSEDREPKYSHYLMKSVARLMSMRERSSS